MRHTRPTRSITILALFLLVFLIPEATHVAAAPAPSTQGVTGMIVPLYSYPGSDWSNLIWAKQANPNVPMVAVVNPADGPGYFIDPNFVAGIDRLESAGVVVLGYVWTDYATRSISSAEQDIATYKSWYGVDGVYLDQMSNVPGQESYYSALTAYAKSLGMTMVIGNPGTSVPASYIGTVTSMVVYENSGAPSTSSLSQLAAYGKGNFAVVAYGVPDVNTAYLDTAANYVGYIYLTNGVFPNPYAPESSYLGNLATALEAYDSTQSEHTTTPGTITVTTVDTDGREIWGMYVTLSQAGAVEQSCFSPCTLSVAGGQSYQVQVSNYDQYVFYDWGNGLQNRYFSVSEPSSATQLSLWAFYDS